MIKLTLFTPKGVEFEGQFVSIQVNDELTGSFGILKDHVPVISTIINGYIYVENEKESYYLSLRGSVLKFKNNEASIVAEDVAIDTSLEASKEKLENMLSNRVKENKARNVELALAENELKKQIKKTGAGSI